MPQFLQIAALEDERELRAALMSAIPAVTKAHLGDVFHAL